MSLGICLQINCGSERADPSEHYNAQQKMTATDEKLLEDGAC